MFRTERSTTAIGWWDFVLESLHRNKGGGLLLETSGGISIAGAQWRGRKQGQERWHSQGRFDLVFHWRENAESQ